LKIRLTAPNAKDEHHLIDVKAFMKIVDHEDFAERESTTIHNLFHENWFRGDQFLPPIFYLTEGVATFINGRHRTLVLMNHLQQIPMALAGMDGYPVHSETPHNLSQKVLTDISIARLTGEEEFEFPDLPVEYLGFDLNLGK